MRGLEKVKISFSKLKRKKNKQINKQNPELSAKTFGDKKTKLRAVAVTDSFIGLVRKACRNDTRKYQAMPGGGGAHL